MKSRVSSFKFHKKGSVLNFKISVADWIFSVSCDEQKFDGVSFVSCDREGCDCTSSISCSEVSSNSG